MSDEPTLLEPGGTFGDFTVVALLGRGAMGEVYKITDGAADYALKIMSTASVDNDPAKRHDSRKRFVREAEAAMKISHPNLVAVYDVGEDPETHLCYILMEYVGGGSLAERIRRKGKLDIREAVSITMHVAKALDAAHRLGVVHRDIKPANIMFTSDGVPKLADLGIARVQGGGEDTTLTKTDMIIGTPAYMSPEQMMNSHDVDARADIYSLGIVLYEMLTGVRPNKDATVVQLLARAIKGEELPDVREMRPEVSAALACAVARMVAQKAEDRPQTAAEAARLVYDAVTGKMTAKAGAGWAARAEALRRREGKSKGAWRLAAGIGGTAAVAALVAAILLKPERAPQPPAEVTRVREVVVTNVVREQRAAPSVAVAPSQPVDDRAAVWKKTGVSVSKGVEQIVENGVEYGVENGVLKSVKLNGAVDVAVPEGVKRIAPWVFKGLKLRRVAIPKSMTGMSASFGDYAIEELHIADVAAWCNVNCGTSTGWPTKGARLYLNGELVRDLVVPGSAVTVKSHVFMDSASIERVFFEEGVQNIGSYAFYGCGKIAQVVLPASLTRIDGFAFSYCTSLSDLAVAAGNRVFEVKNGMLCNRGTQAVVFCPNSVVRAVVPEGTSAILKSAFCGNSRLETVQLPSGIQRIEGYAFCGCCNLRDISIPDGVVHIGCEAFSKCGRLERICLPDSVEKIEDRAFMNCLNLKTAILPARFKDKLDREVFKGCPSCLNVEFGGNGGDVVRKLPADVHSAIANGYHWFYRLEKGGAVLCANGDRPCLEPTPQGKVVVPKELDGRTVSVLDRRAFADCDQMTEIVLPEGLKEIRGERTFVDCRRLKEVQFPATLRLIGFHTFQGCVNLRRINLANCIGVPAGREEYSGAVGGCFLHCPNLEAVDVFASNPAFVSLDGALYSRSRKELLVYPKTRTNVTLPGGVSAIGSSAFASCRGLRTIRLPESVQTIRPWAFECCDNLEELVLPGSVTRIGQKFLVKDASLRRVVFLGDAPAVEASLLAAVPEALVVEVARGSKGWNGPGSTDLPERWPAGAGNDSRPIRYIGETEKPSSAAPPAAMDPAKTTEIFPRLDRDKKAWAYSFERVDGWERPEFDDRKWKRAPGGFGYREYQTDVRWASINTEWKTRHIYLRRHFNWNGGAVSRAVLEFFIDDNINVYLNGCPIYYKHEKWIYWEHGEIDPRLFNNALKMGDNVLCVEAENTHGASYVDCGLRVETGGVISERLRDGVRKVKTAAGTWTIRILNGLVFLGDGQNKALDPEPMGDLEIPAQLDGLKITELNLNCFRGCGLLKKVTVPEGVRSIRQHAFQDCHALESISLPDSLEWILGEVFYQTKLKRLDIKNTRLLCGEALDQCALEEITASPGNPTYSVRDGILFDRVRRALVKCPVSRTDVVLPKGIESIGSEAFQWGQIKSVVIPKSIRLIEPAAFFGCVNLESVEFKCDDANICDVAFKECMRLKEVTLPKNQGFLDGRLVFQNCRNLEEIVVPDTVERIADNFFLSCHSLKRVKIGKRVAFMGSRAFRNCYSIETITLPVALQHMGERVFLNCRSLESVYFEGDAPQVVEERPFEGTPENLTVYVRKGAKGWTDASGNLPEKWPVGDPDARPIRYLDR